MSQRLDLQLFNSLTGAKERYTSPAAAIYVCGITPDGPTHLGHMFTYVTFDVLIRYLRSMGKDVRYVQNITDIDDDMLERSAKRGMTWTELGAQSSVEFWECSDALNNLRPDVSPKASAHIDEIDALNRKLVESGFAYERQGNVYFHALKSNFGKFSGLDESEWLATANERGNSPDDPLKDDPLDFLLWQRSGPGEPEWNSSFGPGRPGWHIECSAMSMRYLGHTLDIHGGGHDLVFPHHEAEIAQSENATGEPFVKTWMHVAMVKSEGEKMSKSLGNLVIVSDLLQRYSPNTVRLSLLSHHYRTPWEFTDEEAERCSELARELSSPGAKSDVDVERLSEEFWAALSDDLDTPKAVSALRETAAGATCSPAAHESYLRMVSVLGLKTTEGKVAS